MKTLIKIARVLSDGHRQELGEFPFLDSDYFNLYHGIAADSGMSDSSAKSWFGFVVNLKEGTVIIQKLLPPEEAQLQIGIGQSGTFDFENLGKYEMTILSID